MSWLFDEDEINPPMSVLTGKSMMSLKQEQEDDWASTPSSGECGSGTSMTNLVFKTLKSWTKVSFLACKHDSAFQWQNGNSYSIQW